jgi:hypothetical protein
MKEFVLVVKDTEVLVSINSIKAYKKVKKSSIKKALLILNEVDREDSRYYVIAEKSAAK